MSTVDHGKALTALLKRLKSKYEAASSPEAAGASAGPARSPMDELLLGILMWDATRSKAEAALRRLRDAHVDDNDLRVSRPSQVAAALGKNYPRAEERAARLHAVLTDLYQREHKVSLDQAMSLSKRDAAKYIETLSGLPPYAAARWQLLVLESHHVPVDDRLLGRLIAAGVLEEGDDVAKATGVLERHIRHEDVLAAHLLLQAWCEDPDGEPAPKGGSRPANTKTAKTSGRKSADDAKPRASAKSPAKRAAAR